MRRIFFILIFSALFSSGAEALAFGHPDSTIPSIQFVKPDMGFPMNPKIQGSAKIFFETKDTLDDNKGGEVVSCSPETKNGEDNWMGRGAVICNQEFSLLDSWCNKEGTSACGVRVNACDNTGKCVRGERFFTIDQTPPVTEISSNRSDPTNQTDVEFAFRASDLYGVDKFECMLDTEQDFSPCASPKKYSHVRDGIREFRVKAFDVAGNFSVSSLVWEVDSTAPGKIEGSDGFSENPFSVVLRWVAPKELGVRGDKASQYDIRYIRYDPGIDSPDTGDITARFETATALVFKEFTPSAPGRLETTVVGPPDNPLTSYTSYLFGIRSRDELWNWSEITTFPVVKTQRDFCDYDADRIFSPNSLCGRKACDPEREVCDLYDNPFDWGLSGDWNREQHEDYAPSGVPWIRKFAQTVKDLDEDGQDVATGRTGLPARLEKEFPPQEGKDWYDNFFTKDFVGLKAPPTLTQLSHTINDLDLDTFVLASWKKGLGVNEQDEPDEADVHGCVNPSALEATCTNCTAYSPDSATGRVPQGKTKAATNESRAVCQIEAYYTKLKGKDQPYEVIKEGTLNLSAPLITASAQCKDGVDNNLNGTKDSGAKDDLSRERTCPTTFSGGVLQTKAPEKPKNTAAIFEPAGLVRCGRDADDFNTPIDESAPCGFCHFASLINRLFNLALLKVMPFLIGLTVVGAGFLLVTSAGRSDQIVRAKNLVRIAILAYAVTLFSWTLLSVFFSVFGIAKWTGFTPVRGEVTSLTPTFVRDRTETWEPDEWKGYFVEIKSAGKDKESAIREIAKNTKDTLELVGEQPFGAAPGVTYHILGTGWWNFVCDISVGPRADFSASPQGGVAPFKVDFTDLSGGDIEKWSWDFTNDGVVDSVAQSPSFTYVSNGPHTVKLTVTGRSGIAAKTDTIYFAPTADFTIAPIRGRAPLTVSFNSDSSKGQITSWLWDFGDPKSNPYHTSTDQSATHTYERPGSYTVKLIVQGPGGKDVKTKLNYIYVYPPPPQPLADFDGGRVVQLLRAKFNNLSLLSTPPFSEGGAPRDYVTSWSWDLNGDGTFDDSRAEHPTYFYSTREKPYAVSLKSIGPGGTSDPKERVDYIAFPPQAHFFAKNPAGSLAQADPFTVNFFDTSTGTVSGWEWDFGDGITDVSNNPKPNHGYAVNGRFKVGLKAKGPPAGEAGEEETGEDVTAQDSYIAIAPRADFEFSSVKLSDPTGPGDCLSGTGCTIGPSGASVTFLNTSDCKGACVSYWEFGDGGASEVNGLGPVTYTYAGTSEVYTVRLTITGPGGGDTMEKKDYIHIAPFANISPEKTGGTQTFSRECPSGNLIGPFPPSFTFTFSGVSQPQPFIKSRSWSTGEITPSITKAFNGSGSVSFTVTNAHGQSDTATASVEIKVAPLPPPCPPPPAEGGGGGANLGADAFLARLPGIGKELKFRWRKAIEN